MARPEGCKCDFRTYMLGDGCPICNPDYWERLAAEIETWPEAEEPDSEQPPELF